MECAKGVVTVAKYQVSLTVTLSLPVEVTAETPEKAEAIARNIYMHHLNAVEVETIEVDEVYDLDAKRPVYKDD